MKKTILALSIIMSSPAMAAEAHTKTDLTGAYIGVKTADFDDIRLTGLTLGYMFNQNESTLIGAEFSYSDGDEFGIDIKHLTLDIVTKIPMNNTFSFKTAIGYGRVEISNGYNSNDDTGLHGELGLGINVTKNLALDVKYAYQKIDDIKYDGPAFGLTYKF